MKAELPEKYRIKKGRLASNPNDKTFWTSENCAEELGVNIGTFLRNYAPNPTFPKRITLPNSRRPLWRADEVIEWVGKFQEK